MVVLAVATLYGGLRLAGASPKFRDLDSLIDGDVYLPGDPEYVTGATMKSTNWNSNFVAVVMVNNEGGALNTSIDSQHTCRPMYPCV